MGRKELDLLIGNEQAKDYIFDCAENGRMPHALILEGAKGSGKSTFARLIAALHGCESDGGNRPCMTCAKCRKILEDNEADVIRIGPEEDRKTIGVEAVRGIRETVYTVPNDLDMKFYVIDDASVMTVQAQNALLKTLEEPPEFVYFLLLATSAASLLPTVRSRAPSLRMQIFTDEELGKIMIGTDKKAAELAKNDPEEFGRLIRAAGGCIGEAKRIIGGKNAGDKSAAVSEKAMKCVTSLACGSKAEFYSDLVTMQLKRDELAEVTRLISLAFRDIAAVRRGCGKVRPLFFTDLSVPSGLGQKFTFPAILRIHEAAERMYGELSTISLNARLASFRLADELWSAAEKR